jgi:NADH-quinone oxidoreductase E subunit
MANKSLPELLTNYRERKHLLLLLKEIQEIYGYLPGEFIPEIARSLDLPVAEVYGVGTFYSFLSAKPQGSNVIRVCKSAPCWLKNCELIVETLQRELGIRPGETTSDGRFSLQLTNCIGACDQAPAMMINDTTYADLTPEKIPEILNGYK